MSYRSARPRPEAAAQLQIGADFKKTLHLANDARRNVVDLPVEFAEEKHVFIKPLFKRARNRHAEYLAQARHGACDAAYEMVALLRHGLKVIAPNLIEVGEGDCDLVCITRAARRAQKREGCGLHGLLRAIHEQHNVHVRKSFCDLSRDARCGFRGVPQSLPIKQYKPVADLKVREQRMEWPAHANPVDQWGEQFAELPMMVA